MGVSNLFDKVRQQKDKITTKTPEFTREETSTTPTAKLAAKIMELRKSDNHLLNEINSIEELLPFMTNYRQKDKSVEDAVKEVGNYVKKLLNSVEGAKVSTTECPDCVCHATYRVTKDGKSATWSVQCHQDDITVIVLETSDPVILTSEEAFLQQAHSILGSSFEEVEVPTTEYEDTPQTVPGVNQESFNRSLSKLGKTKLTNEQKELIKRIKSLMSENIDIDREETEPHVSDESRAITDDLEHYFESHGLTVEIRHNGYTQGHNYGDEVILSDESLPGTNLVICVYDSDINNTTGNIDLQIADLPELELGLYQFFEDYDLQSEELVNKVKKALKVSYRSKDGEPADK